MSDLKFGHIEIFTRNISTAKLFYADALGFEITVEQGPDLTWLQKGALEILLRSGEPPAEALRYEEARAGFVLYTDDIQDAMDKLRNHGVEIRGTVDNEKCYTFIDPDGNWFQLVNPEDH